MDNPRDHVAARLRMRFQQFEERSNDSCKRYNRNLPIKQEKERQENQMFQQRINRSQASKPAKVNKCDLPNKQIASAISDLANNPTNINGSFSDPSLMLQAQKRSYAESFNGPVREDGLVMPSKRMPDASGFYSDDAAQYTNLRASGAAGMVQQMKPSLTSSVSLDHMNATIQPNVNPFLHGSGPPESAQLPRSLGLNKTAGGVSISSQSSMSQSSATALNKAVSGSVNLSSTVTLNISQPNGVVSAVKLSHQTALTVADGAQDIKDIDEVLAKEGLKKIEKLPNTSHLKVETPAPVACDVMHSSQVTPSSAKSEPVVNGYPSFDEDGLPLELAGDLHSIDQFTLFGEVTATSPKQVKKEKGDESSAKPEEPRPAKTEEKSLPGESAPPRHLPQQLTPKQQQVSLTVTQQPQQMQQQQQSQGQAVMQKQHLIPRSGEGLISLSSAVSQQQQQQHVPTMSMSPQNPNSMSYAQPMSLAGASSNPLSKMNQMANMQSLNAGNSMGSPMRSLQSPINSSTSPKSSVQLPSPMNAMSPSLPISSPQTMQGSLPPIQPPTRKGSMRQQSADLSTRQQQLQLQQQQQQQSSPMLPNINNIPTLPGSYMTGPQPSAAEKLQQHLQERMRRQQQQQQQQQRYQLMQQMQQQQQMEMTQKQFMQQQQQQQAQVASMSPMQSPMQQGQNPFQFPADFSTYNQQKQMQGYDQMVMQSPQSSAPAGFYPPPYQIDPSVGAQMFSNNAPPEYRPPAISRNAMLQRLMRERAMASQQMSEVFPQNMMMGGSRMGSMAQSAMLYGHATKAPPQYPNASMQSMASTASMEQQQQQQQQMMMQSGVAQAMQNSSRLSHFSQPDLAMAMSPQSMNHLQGRMRSTMDCYPNPPSLSRSLSTPNDAMMGEAMTPLSGYGGGMPHPAMMRSNPGYGGPNWSSEQQHMLLMQKQQEQQQSLMQQRALAQRQAQGQAGMPTQNFAMLDRTQQINLSQARLGNLASPKNGAGHFHYADTTSTVGNDPNSGVFSEHPSRTLPFSLSDAGLLSPKNNRSLSLVPDSANLSSASSTEMNIPGTSSIPPDEEADLDSLLDNPPPTFDLVNLLS